MPFNELQGRFTNASAVRKVTLTGDGGTWTKMSVEGKWTRAMTIKFMSDCARRARARAPPARRPRARGPPLTPPLPPDANKGFPQFVLEPSAKGSFIVQLNQLPVSDVRSENHFASVDCAVFGLARGAHRDPAGPALVADDFKKFADEAGNVLAPAATRLDERVSSAVDDEQEAITLEGGKAFSLIPYFSGELHADERGYILTVISETPFKLSTIAGGKKTRAGVVDWSGGGGAGGAGGGAGGAAAAPAAPAAAAPAVAAASPRAKVAPAPEAAAPGAGGAAAAPRAPPAHHEDEGPYPGEGGGCCVVA